MKYNFEENQRVESLDTVPENLRPLYAEDATEGGYVLRDDETSQSAIKVIAGLAKSLNAARAEATGLKGKAVDLSALGEYGSTPEEIVESINKKIEEVRAEASEAAGDDSQHRVNLDKVKAEMTKAHAAELESKELAINALKQEIHGYLVNNQFQAAAAKYPDTDAELLQSVLGKHVKVIEGDGQGTESRAVVLDSDGEIRHNGLGGEMTIEELVAEAKKDAKTARLFGSEAPRASGYTGNQRTTPRSPAPKGGGPNGELTPIQKISQGLGKKQFTRGR